MGFSNGLLLAGRVSVVGVSRGRDLEPEKEDGRRRRGIGQCGIWMFEMDEMRMNMKIMHGNGSIGVRNLGV